MLKVSVFDHSMSIVCHLQQLALNDNLSYTTGSNFIKLCRPVPHVTLFKNSGDSDQLESLLCNQWEPRLIKVSAEHTSSVYDFVMHWHGSLTLHAG